MILDNETVNSLTNDDHYENLLKILNWSGYSYWDEYKREKLYYLRMYKKFVIEQGYWDNFPIGSNFAKFCQEVL